MTKTAGLVPIVLIFAFAASFASDLPSGFQETSFVSGLSTPTAMEFAPDGRLFICEKSGQLRVIKNGQLLATPFLTIPVTDDSERGLLGVAFDPNFGSNGRVYVYYTRTTAPVKNRISRFTISGANSDLADSNSEVVILDDIPSDAGNHNGGAIHFGADGKLYVGVGDGGATATNAQDLDFLSGKLLRIDAANYPNIIPIDNPYFNHATARKEIWARGLRNPFTFAVQPGTGKILINDVGQNNWEEINLGVSGANYGWPQAEGNSSNTNFQNPVYAYAHNGNQAAITGGVFYQANQFPAEYLGDYFFGDYLLGFIKILNPNNQAADFASNVPGPVDLKIGPDGSLYYLSIFNGAVYKISYGSGNQNPLAVASANPTFGYAPLPVNFSAQGSSDADSDTLLYFWNFDDGSPTEEGINVSHTFNQNGNYDVQLTVNDQRGGTDTEIIRITVGSTPPTALISTPAENSFYNAGDTVSYSGSGSDPDDGSLPASAMSWTIVFHHDAHTHPFLGPINGVDSGSFEIPRTGETADNVWYRIHLKVTDSSGLTHETTRDIVPRKTSLTIASNPPGLEITLDGQPHVSPYTFTSVVGMQRILGAPSPQTVRGQTYTFVSWSDGGAAAHVIFAPVSNQTYTANYQSERTQLLPDLKPWVGPLPGGLLDANIVVAGGETRLRFSNTVINAGVGPLDVRGVVDNSGVLPAYQRIYYSDGSYEDILVGEFVFEGHEGHDHFHFNNFAIYRLRAVTANLGVGDVVANSDKLSFCITDSDPYDLNLPNASPTAVYNCEQQGISIGWGDLYDFDTFGQWIIIDNVPDGEYWLETEANPDSLLFETTYANNIERIRIRFNKANRTVTILSGIAGALAFTPAHDTRVRSSDPTKGYGATPELRARKSSADQFSFLKFEVNGLSSTAGLAKLQLYVLDGSSSGGSVYLVSNNLTGSSTPWTESNLTFSNSPTFGGSPLSAKGAVSAGQWVEFDVSAVITGNGTYSFGLKTTSSDLVEYSSKDGSQAPALLVVPSTTSTSPPVITSFTPTNGPPGTVVTITGSGFTHVLSVMFEQPVTSPFTVISENEIHATVSVNAVTGHIRVVTLFGNDESAEHFTVLPNDGGSVTTTLNPIHDSYVRSSSLTENRGSSVDLRVRKTSSLEILSCLKFQVDGISSTVQSAKIRLHALEASNDGGKIYAVSNDYKNTNTPWLETGLNYGNAPTLPASSLSSIGAVTGGSVIEFDVASAITGNGTFSFAIKNNSSDLISYSSKEGANPPELVIVSGSGSPAEPPTIASFTPASGPVGSSVTITGSHFSGATSVHFNGVDATFSVASDTQILTQVPNGATAGKISVTTPGGTVESPTGFTVTAPPTIPTIASFTPTNGPVGTNVTINGSNFTGVSSVTFNNVASSNFSVISGNQIAAEVPAGATTGKIRVTNAAGTGVSAQDFVVTSSGSQTLTLLPTDDSFVWSANPSNNYGGSSNLRVRKTSAIQNAYFKFNVSGLNGGVTSAKLRLLCEDASNDGGSVLVASNNFLNTNTPWAEAQLIWTNAPAISGSALSSVGAVSVGQTVEFDVTTAINADGVYTFVMRTNSTDAVYYSSKEGAEPPQLVITFGSASVLAKQNDDPFDDSQLVNTLLPEKVTLLPNYPNPFNAETTIEYGLPDPADVSLLIFNVRGQVVRRIVNGFQPAGFVKTRWDGRDEVGQGVSSGIYFVQLRIGSHQLMQKITLQR